MFVTDIDFTEIAGSLGELSKTPSWRMRFSPLLLWGACFVKAEMGLVRNRTAVARHSVPLGCVFGCVSVCK